MQRVLCLAPFSKKGNQFVSTAFSTIYVILWLSAYVGLLVTSFILMHESKLLSSSARSFLWTIIISFEIVFSFTAYLVMIVYVSCKKQNHIAFLHKLYHVDVLLKHEHKFQINYSMIFYRNITSLIACIVYFDIWFYVSNKADELGYYIFITMYYVEQFTCSILAMSYFNVVLVIRDRFRNLKTIQRCMAKNMGSLQHDEFKHTQNLSMLMLTFKELCDCIDMLNEDLGQIFILRYGHELTLTVSHMFMLFTTLVENDEYTFRTVIIVIFWMMPNIVKMVLPAVASKLAVQEVLFFDYLL